MSHPEKEILRLYPTPSEVIPESRIYEDLWEPQPIHPVRPRIVINMVSSLDGKAAVDGKAGGIGEEVDRRVMRILRSRADGVLVGAGTLRAEKVALDVPRHLSKERLDRGRSIQPLIILLSRSGELPVGNPIRSDPENTVILLPQKLSEGRASLLSERGQLLYEDLAPALQTLKREHGVGLLLVEGGPSVNHELISRRLVDELCVTLSPKLLGGTPENTISLFKGPRFPEPPLSRLHSVHLSFGQESTELFLRYRLG